MRGFGKRKGQIISGVVVKDKDQLKMRRFHEGKDKFGSVIRVNYPIKKHFKLMFLLIVQTSHCEI